MKLLFSLSVLSFSAAYPGGDIVNWHEIDVIPRDGIYVLHDENSDAGSIRFISDFPVSSLRYDDWNYHQPIKEHFLRVVVTSDCPASEVLTSFSDSNEGDAGRVISITSAQSSGIDQTSFLEPSSFFVRWEYWGESTCTPTPAPEDEGSNRRDLEDLQRGLNGSSRTWTSGRVSWTEDRKYIGHEKPGSSTEAEERGGGVIGSRPANREPVTATSHSVTRPPGRGSVTRPPGRGSVTRPPDRPASVTEPTMQGCKVNVDIFHNGCRRHPHFNVNAPIARTIDVKMSTTRDTDDWCAVYVEGDITFPTSNQMIHNTRNADPSLPPVELPQLPEVCSSWAYGRPFTDLEGTPITASLNRHGHQHECLWSSNSDEFEFAPTLASSSDVEQVAKQRKLYGEEWAQKALGEHSSVASFAALVIALMSNNAPPELIQDSLTAAQDEVRHARVSFEVASLFLERQAVEPGALPPSSHKFGQNLTSLALATAEEGCIHETLSAIIMAVEADEQLDRMTWLEPKEKEWLKGKMTAIAMDEARHSSLAWRTIRWVCTVDQWACGAVKRTILESSHLNAIARKRIGKDNARLLPLSDLIETAWSSLHHKLLPLATSPGDSEQCSPWVGEETNSSLTTTVSRLLSEDFCGYSDKSVSE